MSNQVLCLPAMVRLEWCWQDALGAISKKLDPRFKNEKKEENGDFKKQHCNLNSSWRAKSSEGSQLHMVRTLKEPDGAFLLLTAGPELRPPANSQEPFLTQGSSGWEKHFQFWILVYPKFIKADDCNHSKYERHLIANKTLHNLSYPVPSFCTYRCFPYTIYWTDSLYFIVVLPPLL